MFSLSHAIIIVAPQLSAISIQLLVKSRSEYIGVSKSRRCPGPDHRYGDFLQFDVSSETNIESRQKIIANCVEAGVTFIDLSPMYGHSEQVIGRTTMGQQANLQFATKVWTHGRRPGEAQIEQSFELMKADHIDVFQIHNLLDWQTHRETLDRLKDEGRTSVIGITHFRPARFLR